MIRSAYRGEPLTEQELHILRQRSNGISYAEIAKEQDLCVDTIKSRAARARHKLGASTTAQAVFLALKFELIPLEVPDV